MKCPYCGSEETGTVDTRPSGDGRRRRYLCDDCGRRFSTVESAVETGKTVKPEGVRKVKKNPNCTLGNTPYVDRFCYSCDGCIWNEGNWIAEERLERIRAGELTMGKDGLRRLVISKKEG